MFTISELLMMPEDNSSINGPFPVMDVLDLISDLSVAAVTVGNLVLLDTSVLILCIQLIRIMNVRSPLMNNMVKR